MTETTQNTAQKYKGEVLNKIYRVWLFRKFLPVVILEVLILAFLLSQLGRLVFIQQILGNALDVLFSNPTGIGAFVVSTFANAAWGAKLLGVGLVVLAALLIRHLTQGLLRLILVRQNYFSRIKN